MAALAQLPPQPVKQQRPAMAQTAFLSDASREFHALISSRDGVGLLFDAVLARLEADSRPAPLVRSPGRPVPAQQLSYDYPPTHELPGNTGGHSTSQSMAIFYDCITRLSVSTGDVSRETVVLEMIGFADQHGHIADRLKVPASEPRRAARTEAENAALAFHNCLRTRIGAFYCSAIPAVPLWEYLARLQHYLKLSAHTFLVATLLLYRIGQRPAGPTLEHFRTPEHRRISVDDHEEEQHDHPSMQQQHTGSPVLAQAGVSTGHGHCHFISLRTQHRLALTSLRIASKMVEDRCAGQRSFAAVSGISAHSLALLEDTFCRLIDYNLYYLAPSIVDDLNRIREWIQLSEARAAATTG